MNFQNVMGAVGQGTMPASAAQQFPIRSLVMQRMTEQKPVVMGWQAHVPLEERVNAIMQLSVKYSTFRLISDRDLCVIRSS